MNDEEKEIIKKLSADHVDWFLEIIRPLLISNMIHGFKHGLMHRDLYRLRNDQNNGGINEK